MKYSIIASTLVQLVSLASAAAISARQEFEVSITFIGEGSDPSTYFQQFPTDDQPYPIGKSTPRPFTFATTMKSFKPPFSKDTLRNKPGFNFYETI